MKRRNISYADLITQGELIRKVDDKYSGEAWHFPPDLRDDFDTAFDAFHEAFALCANIRIDKETAAKEARERYFALRKSLSRLKRYFFVVADKHAAKKIFEELQIADDYPTKQEDMQFLAKEHIPPKLDDWDGTPQEISPAMKTEVANACEDFFTKSMANSRLQAQSQVATAERNTKLREYKAVLTRIRNWLCLMLPKEKSDKRIEEYGFEAYKKPHSNKPRPPKNFAYDPKTGVWRWDAVDGEGVVYELVFRRRYNTGRWTSLYEGSDTQTANMPGAQYFGKFDFRVRAIEGDYRGIWSEVAVAKLPL